MTFEAAYMIIGFIFYMLGLKLRIDADNNLKHLRDACNADLAALSTINDVLKSLRGTPLSDEQLDKILEACEVSKNHFVAKRPS